MACPRWRTSVYLRQPFARGLSLDRDRIGVVYESAQDGIGQGCRMSVIFRTVPWSAGLGPPSVAERSGMSRRKIDAPGSEGCRPPNPMRTGTVA